MGRPRAKPPDEPLPDRLNGEHAHAEPSVPTSDGNPLGLTESEEETMARMNAESRQRMAEEAPIAEGATTSDHPAFLPGLAPVHYPELDTLATARHQAMQARQAASQVEKDANTALIDKMHALNRTAYTSIDGLIVSVVPGKEKVTTKHDSGKKTKSEFTDDYDESKDDLDEEDDREVNAA